jgi:hypothetical protein
MIFKFEPARIHPISWAEFVNPAPDPPPLPRARSDASLSINTPPFRPNRSSQPLVFPVLIFHRSNARSFPETASRARRELEAREIRRKRESCRHQRAAMPYCEVDELEGVRLFYRRYGRGATKVLLIIGTPISLNLMRKTPFFPLPVFAEMGNALVF